ncbi:MAG: sigma-54-dependent Fis family transcriptional regulator [Candidatus Eisenbacteria bacterium]|nr:sigma-54-dependent Fis family transcriptional regulator [Candidatus Eisenbacteria bacterium]
MKPEARILLVDDSPSTLEVLERHLSAEGHSVAAADGTRRALELLSRDPFDLVIADLRMPDGDGMDLVRHVRERLPDTEVMMITGYATIQGAVDAVKTGAAEYLAKPFTREELLAAVERALERLRTTRRACGTARDNRFGLVGECEPMVAAFAAMERLAGSESRVLFLGEPGTGRSTAARALAALDRPGRTLVEASLAGPEDPVELLKRAAGGTVLLHDAAWAPPSRLEALGRVLSRRGLREARVLAVAEPDLAELATHGKLMREVLGALAEVQIALPPLRERGGDISALAEHFAARLPATGAGPAFAGSARAALLAYGWPGNLTELRQVVATSLSRSAARPLERRDLPAAIRETSEASTQTLAEVEIGHIRRVLASVGGNKSRAAALLGINRKTLTDKLRPGPA